MKKVLFAWIGATDLNASQGNSKAGLGPICQAVLNRPFDDIVLLSDYPREKTEPYMAWLDAKGILNAQKVDVNIGSTPTDYRAIYETAKRLVGNYEEKEKGKVDLTFHLSPGTPQMATVWILLANSCFDAKLIQTSLQQGVEDVELPFAITADYLPALFKKNERRISKAFDRDDTHAANFKEIIHKSPVMKTLVERAKKAALYQVPVLIQGESGTGKELLAKAIHTTSLRRGRFIAINCGAIPEELFESELFGHRKGSFTGATGDKAGYLEEAAGGTLFLDEIGEMPLRIQVKLLRVLQEETFFRVGESVERKADVRIISATNRNLSNEITIGTFREDLFHRLAVAVLHVPPLREREGDVDLLVDGLLDAVNRKLTGSGEYRPKKLEPSGRALLLGHDWPGNVRELQNTLMRAAIWSSRETIDKQAIKDAMLPAVERQVENDGILGRPLSEGFDLIGVLGEVARHYLARAMKECPGNRSAAARLLNFKSYQRLDAWLKKFQSE